MKKITLIFALIISITASAQTSFTKVKQFAFDSIYANTFIQKSGLITEQFVNQPLNKYHNPFDTLSTSNTKYSSTVNRNFVDPLLSTDGQDAYSINTKVHMLNDSTLFAPSSSLIYNHNLSRSDNTGRLDIGKVPGSFQPSQRYKVIIRKGKILYNDFATSDKRKYFVDYRIGNNSSFTYDTIAPLVCSNSSTYAAIIQSNGKDNQRITRFISNMTKSKISKPDTSVSDSNFQMYTYKKLVSNVKFFGGTNHSSDTATYKVTDTLQYAVNAIYNTGLLVATNKNYDIILSLPSVLKNQNLLNSDRAYYAKRDKDRTFKVYLKIKKMQKVPGTGDRLILGTDGRDNRSLDSITIVLPIRSLGNGYNTLFPQSLASSTVQFDENNNLYFVVERTLYKYNILTKQLTKLLENSLVYDFVLYDKTKMFILAELNSTRYTPGTVLADTIVKFYEMNLSNNTLTENTNLYTYNNGKRFCPTYGLTISKGNQYLLATGLDNTQKVINYTVNKSRLLMNTYTFDGRKKAGTNYTWFFYKGVEVKPFAYKTKIYKISDTVTGIEDEELSNPNSIIAYPNPNEGTFKIAGENIESVLLTDISGNTETITSNFDNVTSSLKGLVIAKIVSQNKVSLVKLIIN